MTSTDLPQSATLGDRHELVERWESLKEERSPRIGHWQDISTFLVPYNGKFLTTDKNRRVDRYQNIIDETGPHAVNVLRSGMTSLRTSPARRWARFQTRDPGLNKRHRNRKWFTHAMEVVRWIFQKSNVNAAWPHHYGESATFGTSAAILTERPDKFMHSHMLTAGEYAIAPNEWGEIDTCYREFEMTAATVRREFGEDRISETVKKLIGDRNFDAPVPIIHAIEPRADRDPFSRRADQMPFKSVYFERDVDRGDQYLRVSGHSRFPCVVSRWEITGGDWYGEGPGTMALGSTRQLQQQQLALANGIEHQSDPATQVPADANGRDIDLLPGGQTPYNQTSPNGGVRNAFDVPLRLDFMLDNIRDVRQRVNESFHKTLFQPVSALSDSTQRTAEEIIQRRSEMLTVLGPVTIRMNTELDGQYIMFALEQGLRLGLIPPPPEELLGQDLDVEYIGPLAQALKMADAELIDRMVIHLGQLAALKPDVLDRYDFDNDVERYSDMLGVDPDLIVPGQQAMLIRQQRAQLQQQAAQLQAAQATAATAKDASAAAGSQGEAAVAAAMEQFTGMGAPA